MAMKRPELLSEIEQKEYERRDKAWRFEKMTNEAARLRKSIAHLTSLAKANDVKALEQMHALCGHVPKDLTTKGSRFMPGGFNVHSTLQIMIGDALADVTRTTEAAQKALTTVRQQLAQVEAALKGFEQGE